MSFKKTLYNMNMKKVIFSIFMFFAVAQAWAVDTYNPANGQLTIPQIVVGDSIYSNVTVTVKEVLNVKGGVPIANFDIYNPVTNILTIPSVSVSSKNYTNVSINVGNVTSVSDARKSNQLPSTLAILDYSSFTSNTCNYIKLNVFGSDPSCSKRP